MHLYVCESVCLCVRERVCVCERESEYVCVRESVCLCVCTGDLQGCVIHKDNFTFALPFMCVCVCVYSVFMCVHARVCSGLFSQDGNFCLFRPKPEVTIFIRRNFYTF